MLRKASLVGMARDEAIKAIYRDIDHSAYSKFYWVSIPSTVESQSHYIRFPYGSDLTVEYDGNGIVCKAY